MRSALVHCNSVKLAFQTIHQHTAASTLPARRASEAQNRKTVFSNFCFRFQYPLMCLCVLNDDTQLKPNRNYLTLCSTMQYSTTQSSTYTPSSSYSSYCSLCMSMASIQSFIKSLLSNPISNRQTSKRALKGSRLLLADESLRTASTE